MAAIALESDLVRGMPASAIFRIVATSPTTMKRHGWLFWLLPVQRATSARAARSASSTGSSVNSRTWRVRRSGRTCSDGSLTRAMVQGRRGETGCLAARVVAASAASSAPRAHADLCLGFPCAGSLRGVRLPWPGWSRRTAHDDYQGLGRAEQ